MSIKFKVGDKIKIGNYYTYVREVYSNLRLNDEYDGLIKYMDENGYIAYAWASECELVDG